MPSLSPTSIARVTHTMNITKLKPSKVKRPSMALDALCERQKTQAGGWLQGGQKQTHTIDYIGDAACRPSLTALLAVTRRLQDPVSLVSQSFLGGVLESFRVRVLSPK